MLITNLSRVQLLSVLPKGGIVAEVGVQKGLFSERIRQITEPDELHLIDPWALDNNDEYLTAYRASRDGLRQAMDHVRQIFYEDIVVGRVLMHRDYSTRVAATFPDDTFDWVYIDAMHDFENVRADLLAFRPKVKLDGFILGHDFSNYFNPKHFGVIPAVREFIRTQGFELVLITNESNPTYLLARYGNDTTVPSLRSALLSHKSCSLIEVDDGLLGLFQQVEVVHPDGRKVRMIKFG